MTDSAQAAPAPPQPLRTSDAFVARMHELCRSPQARAALRRGLGLPVERCVPMHRYLVPLLVRNGDPYHEDVKRAHYGVAALIAARPRSQRDRTPEAVTSVPWWRRPSLGASLGQAVTKGVLKGNTAENTLHLMARQSADAVHRSLPTLVPRLLTGEVPVDWAVLLEDLASWNRDRDRIATRWLEDYFRAVDPDDERPDGTPDTPDTFDDPAEENDR